MGNTIKIPRLFAKFGLPHSNPSKATRSAGFDASVFDHKGGVWCRRDGSDWLLTRTTPDNQYGLPWGKWAKLLIMLLATAAHSRGTRRIDLPSIAKTLSAMGINSASGGATGNISALKESISRLLGTRFISIDGRYAGDMSDWVQQWVLWVESGLQGHLAPTQVHDEAAKPFVIADSFALWDDAETPYIELSEAFYDMCLHDSIDLDADAVRSLQRSVRQLEAYCWLNTIGARGLGPVTLKSGTIARQLGYTCPAAEAKAGLLEALEAIKLVWPEVEFGSELGHAELSLIGFKTSGSKVMSAAPAKAGTITVTVSMTHVRQIAVETTNDEQAMRFLGRVSRKAARRTGTPEERAIASASTATVSDWKK